MRDTRVAAAQFEHRDGDQAYNPGRICDPTRKAVDDGAEIVCFHELWMPASGWIQPTRPEEAGRDHRARAEWAKHPGVDPNRQGSFDHHDGGASRDRRRTLL
ncbi:MAG TPA: hypothetical protein PLL20_12395 [Phycisphaerae bacterium]|nr:hypothetical protein [Phycisphaerae bacterium]HRR83698.1 hypothetical protein [Phycisphaerae bacterium]